MSEYDEIDLGEECDICGELLLHCTCEDDERADRTHDEVKERLARLRRASEKAFVQLCAPHGKDWLTCPECAKAAVNGNPKT